MTDMIEQDVARHYGQGGLEAAILAGLRRMGRQADEIDPADLAGVEEFHIGGRQATIELVEKLQLGPDTAVLDIGCGIGGTARFLAAQYKCPVTGIDVTPEFVAVGNMLSERVGLRDSVGLEVGSALALPFDSGRFDRATLIHVGMNIADKRQLFAEAARVLKPGGLFAAYEVMRIAVGEIGFPVPWATNAATSFLAAPEEYRDGLAEAGFDLIAERERREFAVAFFRALRERMAAEGPPPLGLPVIMGQDAPAKIANMVAALEAGIIAPVEMVARRR